jgi:hypothetical protein
VAEKERAPGAALRDYLAEAVLRYGRDAVPTYADIGKACRVHINVIARMAWGSSTLNLRLGWQVIVYLRQCGLDATVSSLITWPLPAKGPILESGFVPETEGPPRLHLRLAELRQRGITYVEATRAPMTSKLARGAQVSRRTIERWYDDQQTYVPFGTLYHLAQTFIDLQYPVHPEDLLAYPADGTAIMATRPIMAPQRDT